MTETPNWQYPANPDDGDFVIRGNIKATYDASTQTWDVGEIPQYPGIEGPVGPPGPEGPKGDPGQGVEIAAIFDRFVDLPSPPQYEDQFVIVDETNTLYFSDGINWFDLGSPIQGPKGDDGTDGTDGANGVNGRNGTGWTGTTIIDERDQEPPNYQIRFDSNDGLDFVTDNIMGEKGDPGELEIASEDNIGGIKIGRGLNILPDGTLQAGETYVDLETVPLGPDGAPEDPEERFAFQFVPSFFNKQDDTVFITQQYAAGTTSNQSGTVRVPEIADGAIVYFFVGSDCENNFAAPGGYGLQWTIFAQLTSTLTIDGAEFVSEANALGQQMVHNYSIGSEARRRSNVSSFKVGYITFPFGTTELGINVQTVCNNAQRAKVSFGRSRVILIPFKDGDIFSGRSLAETRAIFGISSDEEEVIGSDPDSPPLPSTEDEIKDQNTNNLKQELMMELSAIDIQLAHYKSGPIYDQLESIREQLYNLQNLPGTFEEIQAEWYRLAEEAEPYTTLSFRFE